MKILTLFDIMQLPNTDNVINITTNDIQHDNRKYDNDPVSISDFKWEQLTYAKDAYIVTWSTEEGDPTICVGLNTPIDHIADSSDSEYQYTLIYE